MSGSDDNSTDDRVGLATTDETGAFISLSTAVKQSIGWIGAGGRMGFAMAKRLIESGCDVKVYNRTRSKVEALAELGAEIVDSPADLRDRDIVFSSVSTSKDLLAVTTGSGGVLGARQSPRLFIDCSTVSEEASREIREAAAKLGTRMLSAPVSGNAKVVKAGQLTIVASGPKDAFDIAEPYLAALGAGVTYVGEGERARIVKICHNLMLGVVAQCLAEITVLAEKSGVPRHAFLAFLNSSVVGSQFTRYKTPAFVNLDLTPTFTPVLLRKDLELGLSAGKSLGVPLPLTQLTRDIVDGVVNAGHTDCDFAVLLHEQAKASGLTLEPENVEVGDGLS
jgi:3-hydroxyisobutyrate dehydrogenase-like beta-hydroxyacid dehydrogenase